MDVNNKIEVVEVVDNLHRLFPFSDLLDASQPLFFQVRLGTALLQIAYLLLVRWLKTKNSYDEKIKPF